MTHLQSFPDSANVAIIGASGGIGRAMLALLEDDERVRTL